MKTNRVNTKLLPKKINVSQQVKTTPKKHMKQKKTIKTKLQTELNIFEQELGI